MPEPIVVLGPTGSRLAPRLGQLLAERGVRCAVGSQDAVLERRPVTVGRGRAEWDGMDLRRAACVFLERPVFLWPQSGRIAAAPAPAGAPPGALPQSPEREARSLTVSALACARRLVNPMEAGALAASRPMALTQLAAAGLPVAPWRVVGAPDVPAAAGVHHTGPGRPDDRLIFDIVGGDRWHEAGRPPAGDLCLAIDRVAGPVTGILIVGGGPAAAIRYGSCSAWEAGRGGEPIDPARLSVGGTPGTGGSGPDADTGLAGIARRAAEALDLDFIEVWLAETGPDGVPAVLLAEAGPDLDRWDTTSRGEVAPRLADLLTGIARRGEGGSA